jgi:hypothetical protein
VPKFGTVIVGAGLALLYFAAVAAYAVPATAVVHDPLVAAAWQWIATAVVIAAALYRRSEATAVMAAGFGLGAIWTGLHAGLPQFPLWSALGLAVGAVILRFRPGWRAPWFVAMPGTYAVLLLWCGPRGGDPVRFWLPLLAAFVILSLPDLALAWARRPRSHHGEGQLAVVNSSLALAAGWWLTWRGQPEALEAFYFDAALVLLLTLPAWRRAAAGSVVLTVTLSQIAALVALGVMAHFDGQLRSLVLLAQATVLLVIVRASGLRGLRVLFYAVLAVSWLQFLHTLESPYPPPWPPALIYLGLASALLGFEQRWLAVRPAFSVMAGVLLGFAAWRSGHLHRLDGWAVAWDAGLALVLVAGGWPARAWRAPTAAGAMAWAAACVAMLDYHPRLFPPWHLWANGGALVAAVLVLGGWWDRTEREPGRPGRAGRWVLAIATALVVQLVFWDGLRHAQDLTCGAALALGLLLASPRARRWPLAIAGVAGLAYGLWLQHPWRVRPDFPLLFAAAALAWAWMIAWRLSPARQEAVRAPDWRRALPWIMAVLATWITGLALRSNFTGASLLAVTAIEALAVFFLALKLGVRPAWPAAAVLGWWGAWWAVLMMNRSGLADGDWQSIGAVVLLGGVLLAMPVAARGFAEGRSRRLSLWLQGGVALALVFRCLALQPAPLAAYATVGWGGAAIAVFAMGLFLRERICRLLGLGGLVLCVPRMFRVDLDSTLYRIVAFVVLGMVLLWVGFSYHRFRHFITEEERLPEDAEKL